MLRFFLVFLFIQLSMFGVNMLSWVQVHLVLPWTALLARACAAMVTTFDATAAAAGKVLWNTQTGFGVSIEPGCNGIEACIVLFSAIVAFPASWRHKLIGLGVGFVAVQGLNIVRVISLFYLGQWSTPVFNFAHEYLWQALIMLDVLVVWLLWVRAGSKSQQVSPPSDEPPSSPPPGASPPVPVPPTVSTASPAQGLISTSLDLSPPSAR